jgi:hypothetical protein
MKWLDFKQLTAGEILDHVQAWEAGEDEAGAQEFVTDFMDNVIFQFTDGSIPETISDSLIAIGVPQVWQQVASRLGRLASGVLNARPLLNLPF